MDAVLVASNIWKTLEGTTVLRGANLALQEGDIALLTGENGAGKTTLLNILSGIDRATRGEVSLQGASLRSGDFVRCARTLQHQRAFGSASAIDLIGLATVSGLSSGNVAAKAGRLQRGGAVLLFALRSLCEGRVARASLRERAVLLLAATPLSLASYDVPTAQLTPGQRQLVAFVLVVAMDLPVWFLDEPLVGLDEDAVRFVTRSIQSASERGVAILIVDHRQAMRSTIASRLLTLSEGRLCETSVSSAQLHASRE